MISYILDELGSLPYFTLQGVEQLLADHSLAAGSVRTALYRWMSSGRIIQLKKGVYMSRRFFEAHRREADFSSAVSAILLPQSYVSMEFVLQRHNVLTEATYPVSAVTVKNTRTFSNPLGTFTYRHIKPLLYQGFSIQDFYGIPFAMASVAKSLFDYLYLRRLTDISSLNLINLAEDLRLNLDEFTSEDIDEFVAHVASARSPKMDMILKNLRKYQWHPWNSG